MTQEKQKHAFELDPFQKKAIQFIEQGLSVLVSAPTGAGKTVIAERVIEMARQKGQGVIYTAPIKTLSNQKYRDFKDIYPGEVGIVTGDVSINPDAPILIMTTEIYRNSLFENSKRIEKTGWVIYDEIHYLSDPERGTVWEEAIMFTPDHIKILALSATVPNIEELAEWMQDILEVPIKVVIEHHRPVPLSFQYLCQGKVIHSKKDLLQKGYLGRATWQMKARHGKRLPYLKLHHNRHDKLLEHLAVQNHLPCIYFTFGRKRTEALAYESLEFHFLKPKEQIETLKVFDDLVERYSLLGEKSAEDMRSLVAHGIAFHHAGMLPSLKEVIEELFTHRLIKLIFTTETFALGINMPARAVIFDDLQKYYGDGFRDLTTRDFYQMAGRAGRRGMDDQGNVYVRVNPKYLNYQSVIKIIYGDTEPIFSQFNAAYATLLNLFRFMGYELIKIYPDSLHCYQSSKKRRLEASRLMERKIDLFKHMGYIKDEKLTQKGEFASALFGYELILAEMYDAGELDQLSVSQLCMLLSALAFEPRKNTPEPKMDAGLRKLENRALHYYRLIHYQETKYKVHPHTRPPHFHLAPAIQAWSRNLDFDKIFRFADVDEGEMIRNFRMVIQLLRELRSAPYVSDDLKDKARLGLDRIKRDIVDAEASLGS